jgi:hypothetical protein
MSGTGFTVVDYELFVQKSDAATNYTVEPVQTKQTSYIHQLRTRFEVLLKSSAHSTRTPATQAQMEENIQLYF